MAYNKAREEKKWRLWKEAEEKQLRSLGVSESDIETLRVHDWAIFNSDRRYYQRMQETGTYLEEVAADMTQPEINTVEDFLDNIENQQLYQVLIKVDMSNLINKDEFTATRASCDAEIEELQSIIESVDKQREMIEQQQQLLKEIEDAIKEIVSGVEYEDEFYKHILDKMVVQDKDNIDVYLNLLPMKWSYTVAKASKKAVASEWNISEASLPMSVSMADSSGYGMA